NAVRHAVAVRDEPTRVTVRSVIIGDTLELSVSDDGAGFVASVDGFGVGLTNVRARLDELYGEAQRFAAGAPDSGGFRAEIVLPLSPASAAVVRGDLLDVQFA